MQYLLDICKSILSTYDTPQAKWFLYVSIAFLTSIYNGLTQVATLADLDVLFCMQVFILSIIQALIAWRAFIDQSITSATEKKDRQKKENQKLTISN